MYKINLIEPKLLVLISPSSWFEELDMYYSEKTGNMIMMYQRNAVRHLEPRIFSSLKGGICKYFSWNFPRKWISQYSRCNMEYYIPFPFTTCHIE